MSVDSSLRRGFSTSGSSSQVPDPQSQSEVNGNDQNSQTAATVSVDRSGLFNPPREC